MAVKVAMDSAKAADRDNWSRSAFVAWLQGAGEKLTFGDFLKKYGLNDKPAKKVDKAKQLADVERISQAHKRRKRETV
jgi:hypothetical protein